MLTSVSKKSAIPTSSPPSDYIPAAGDVVEFEYTFNRKTLSEGVKIGVFGFDYGHGKVVWFQENRNPVNTRKFRVTRKICSSSQEVIDGASSRAACKAYFAQPKPDVFKVGDVVKSSRNTAMTYKVLKVHSNDTLDIQTLSASMTKFFGQKMSIFSLGPVK